MWLIVLEEGCGVLMEVFLMIRMRTGFLLIWLNIYWECDLVLVFL